MTHPEPPVKRAPEQPHVAPAILPEIPQIRGAMDGVGFRMAIVVSRFNTALTTALFRAAVNVLTEHGVANDAIQTVWVPGAFEIPGVLEQLARQKQYDALIALGVVIEGETEHGNLINAQVHRSLCDISRVYSIPILDGVVAARNPAQAQARTAPDEHNRGRHAALAAIEMVHVFRQLKM